MAVNRRDGAWDCAGVAKVLERLIALLERKDARIAELESQLSEHVRSQHSYDAAWDTVLWASVPWGATVRRDTVDAVRDTAPRQHATDNTQPDEHAARCEDSRAVACGRQRTASAVAALRMRPPLQPHTACAHDSCASYSALTRAFACRSARIVWAHCGQAIAARRPPWRSRSSSGCRWLTLLQYTAIVRAVGVP